MNLVTAEELACIIINAWENDKLKGKYWHEIVYEKCYPLIENKKCYPLIENKKRCYECNDIINHLFDDGRCKLCTRLTPEEVGN